MLSNRIQKLEPSPTLSLDAKVKEMQAGGQPIINLGLGEPDFATPENIGEAAIAAIREGFTHYTPAAGIAELRETIAQFLLKNNHLEYSPDQIVVGVGSKAILYNIFQVLCNPGDEVVVSTPTWSTYLEQIKLSGAEPVEIPLKTPFKLTASDVASKITNKTKIILLNSPSNPTGAMIEDDELRKIGELASEKKIYIISDEIYDQLTYDQKQFTSIASISPAIKERTITVNGFSKSYAMTGWRIGYAAGPKDIVKALVALQGQITSNTSSIAQKAAIAALQDEQSAVIQMKIEFAKRREYLFSELSKIEGLSIVKPEGAFYYFIGIADLLSDKWPDSTSWCKGLLEQDKVAVVPGEAFHFPGYFRLSFAASIDDLQKGVRGIKNFAGKR